jgi:peptidoglycan hydrolase-like protein with peptidoglycan-binding domain
MYIHTGEWLGQPQKPLISEYIKWVQRSLNLRGECLQVDGLESPAYRAAVKRFQNKVGLSDTGKIDARTQDALILSNQRNPFYISWVQTALNHPKTARLDPVAIRQFQEVAHFLDPNIKVDGVVGPKTEAAIVRIAFLQPPGECV